MKKLPPALLSVSCALLAVLQAGCSEGVDWSTRERENAQHIQASLQATSDAAVIFNEARTPQQFQARREKLLQALRAAHLHAAQVNDSVLDKLHPQLYVKFRLEYQRALGRMINAYEADDFDAAAEAAGDVRDFMNWYRDNSHRFRWWEDAMP